MKTIIARNELNAEILELYLAIKKRISDLEFQGRELDLIVKRLENKSALLARFIILSKLVRYWLNPGKQWGK